MEMDSPPNQEDSDHGIKKLEGEFYLWLMIYFRFWCLFCILGDPRTRRSKGARRFPEKKAEEI